MENPEGIILSMGGQLPNNIAMALHRQQVSTDTDPSYPFVVVDYMYVYVLVIPGQGCHSVRKREEFLLLD